MGTGMMKHDVLYASVPQAQAALILEQQCGGLVAAFFSRLPGCENAR